LWEFTERKFQESGGRISTTPNKKGKVETGRDVNNSINVKDALFTLRRLMAGLGGGRGFWRGTKGTK